MHALNLNSTNDANLRAKAVGEELWDELSYETSCRFIDRIGDLLGSLRAGRPTSQPGSSRPQRSLFLVGDPQRNCSITRKRLTMEVSLDPPGSRLRCHLGQTFADVTVADHRVHLLKATFQRSEARPVNRTRLHCWFGNLTVLDTVAWL